MGTWTNQSQTAQTGSDYNWPYPSNLFSILAIASTFIRNNNTVTLYSEAWFYDAGTNIYACCVLVSDNTNADRASYRMFVQKINKATLSIDNYISLSVREDYTTSIADRFITENNGVIYGGRESTWWSDEFRYFEFDTKTNSFSTWQSSVTSNPIEILTATTTPAGGTFQASSNPWTTSQITSTNPLSTLTLGFDEDVVNQSPGNDDGWAAIIYITAS